MGCQTSPNRIDAEGSGTVLVAECQSIEDEYEPQISGSSLKPDYSIADAIGEVRGLVSRLGFLID
jgi:hypothetical protein